MVQISLSVIASVPALEPNQAPVHGVTLAASEELKRSGHEACHSTLAIAEVKNW